MSWGNATLLRDPDPESLGGLAEAGIDSLPRSEDSASGYGNAQARRSGPVRDGFKEVVGANGALKKVMKLIQVVAPLDTTVLIEGETGTGKEVIAHAIHQNSARRYGPFVALNCAAIPPGLLESELFGHERGAFTGAITRKSGRLEAANCGTLFLDEVGDVPLELQPKLLRVLQEREFERIGGNQTVRVKIRVIAATNRDLATMVSAKQFRDDLFYRLRVFPIELPPLRKRREDLPLLVNHFVRIHSHQMGKQIDTIPEEVMDVLTNYSWPGNIRELQNLIERSVILAADNVLRPPLASLQNSPEPNSRKPRRPRARGGSKFAEHSRAPGEYWEAPTGPPHGSESTAPLSISVCKS